MSSGVRWIRRTDELETLVERIDGGVLGLDTESDSFHSYPERLCLLQLSFGGQHLLVDPLAGVDLCVLGTPLGQPRVRKVLHGADYDLRVLDREAGLRVRGLFDTMVAARFVGEREFGLAALLEKRFGVRLDKRHQLADWSRRPLPPAMEAYAVADTRHLEPLAAELEDRLTKLGRWDWAAEEFRRLEEVRPRGAPERESFRRIKGSGSLDGRGLAVLRELVELRERMARRRGRPPFRIVGNAVLLRLARTRPRTPDELARIGELRRASAAERERWLAALRRGLELPRERWPESGRGRRPPRDPVRERRLRWLGRRRDALAHDLGLEPSVVAPRALLESLLACIENGEDPAETPELRRWQHGLLAPAIAELTAD